MSDDEEVLPINNDLSRYIISEGFTDFETYNQPRGSSRYDQVIKVKSSLSANGSISDLKPKTFISSEDYGKLSKLLTSKLLLPDDFELIEYFLSKTIISKRQTKYSWVFRSGIVVTTTSAVLYFKKRIGAQIPIALLSLLSLLSLKSLYCYFCGLSENKSFTSAIGCMQTLCLNVNKLFRLLRETEVLSSGQVSTQNVGAALYLPIKSLEEPQRLPSWKTLPHLRKCLAYNLLDVIDVLKTICDEAKKIIPDWLHIEGCTFTNDYLLTDNDTIDNLKKTDYNISLRDLQSLNDSYLILQSEFLRWVGLCICPSSWDPYDSRYEVSRTKILKLFCSAHSQLRIMSHKLGMQYDIKTIFSDREQSIKTCGISKIDTIQCELHCLYLLILSMLIQIKNLEDQFENNSTSHAEQTNFKENISRQLNDVRNELSLAVNKFNSVFVHTFSNETSESLQSPQADDTDTDCATAKSLKDFPEDRLGKQDCNPNVDEVFLAITDQVYEQDKLIDNWDIEDKPLIPKTLLSELSTTLKPIKEQFKEREKVALERAGLEDLENESNSDIEAPDGGLLNIPPANASRKKNESKQKRNQYKYRNIDGSESDSSLSMEESETPIKSIRSSIQTKSNIHEDSNRTFSALSDGSIANMIAMKSQTWGLAEEDYYSDD